MFIDRFKDVLVRMRDDAMMSLPICDQENETVFCYYLQAVENCVYRVKEVLSIYTRNRKDGTIIECDPEPILLKSGIDFTKTFSPSVPSLKALEYRRRYCQLYEKYVEAETVGLTNREYHELWDLFETLVPDSALRELYVFLSPGFFTDIRNKKDRI